MHAEKKREDVGVRQHVLTPVNAPSSGFSFATLAMRRLSAPVFSLTSNKSLSKCFLAGLRPGGRFLSIKADDICTNNAFVWGDLNARNQPSAFLYGET